MRAALYTVSDVTMRSNGGLRVSSDAHSETPCLSGVDTVEPAMAFGESHVQSSGGIVQSRIRTCTEPGNPSPRLRVLRVIFGRKMEGTTCEVSVARTS